MKQLLFIIALLATLGTANEVDLACVKDCMAEGKMMALCQRLCEF